VRLPPNHQSTTRSGDELLVPDTSSNIETAPSKVELGEFNENIITGDEIQRLLEEQQDDRLDKQGELLEAIRKDRFEVVQFLVDKCGADVNMHNSNGSNALLEAARNGHVDILRFLVAEGGARVDMRNNYGSTVLTLAARGGRVDVVRLVHNWDTDVNIHESDRLTALMEGAGGGHMSVVQFLVNEGVDVNIRDSKRSTALMEASHGGHMDVVRFLVDEWGAGVNMRNSNGSTALMEAASNGHIAVVRFLLAEGGARVNALNSYGSTALMEAAGGGHTNVVQFLVTESGASVHMQNNYGSNALILAALGGHLDVVRFLVTASGTDENMQDDHRSTALMKAAHGGHVDVVHFLVTEGGTDVNSGGNNGWTALMLAAQAGHVNVVRFLVAECDADVNMRNAEAHTALRIASDHGHIEIVHLLTPFAQPRHRSTIDAGHKSLNSDASRSIAIPPSEVELGAFDGQRNVGGDFRVKWLGADAVVKLFLPDASVSTFEQEVRAWQTLRHPNVLKLYGVCQAAPNVNFFVCEYASRGSLAEYAASLSSSSDLKPLTWKFLYEAALGLEYLHERGIIHGDLRCSNILIGNDGLAKLSNFSLTGEATNPRSVIRSMRWQAPEVLEGSPASRESDVYSLGMCILEAASGNKPWSAEDERTTRFFKLNWNGDAHASVPYNKRGSIHPCGDTFVRSDDSHFFRRSRELVWQMCCQRPHDRSSLTSIISELEQLSVTAPQPEAEAASCFEGCKGEGADEQWQKLRQCMDNGDNAQHGELFTKLQHICGRLQESEHSYPLLDRFYSLVADLYQTVKMTSEEAWAMRLSCTRATSTSMISFTRCVDALLKALGESVPEETDISRQQQRREQGVVFVSGIADTVLLLQTLKSVEERCALLNSLRSEIENAEDKYTEEQLRTMQKTYEVIESKLALEGVKNAATLTPKWFIPWWELILDEGEALGTGDYGSVQRAKWLDSDVVVKQVLLPGSDTTASSDSFYDSLCAVRVQSPTDPETVAKRAEAQEMFRREADIWFGFSHPHVVRLFGACHIGRPFFVCEYATHGTLVSYLRQHPDKLWAKLHEAALGVQYLHARGVVHGDLKGNNVVIGSDLKAKVTDFGLSLAVESEAAAPISGAWHWVAPECLVGKKAEQKGVKPTFESDVYSLGMCIVEALRVVETVQDGKPSYGCLPWGRLDNPVVKHHVTRGKLPSRPSICTNDRWTLVTRMCVLNPKKRIKISTVVDELERFVKMSTGSNTTNQAGLVTDDVAALTYPVNQESVVSLTAAAHKLLSQVRGNSNQQDNVPVVLYDSLWDRIQHVREQIEGSPEAGCKSAFHALVVEAQISTASLVEARSGDLVSLARVLMGCYALSRRLDKLCDAHFLRNPRKLEFSETSQ
jgi:serine/threonine protein kinase/ankyrin repeat protein